jgi:hypothetical protein
MPPTSGRAARTIRLAVSTLGTSRQVLQQKEVVVQLHRMVCGKG